MGCGLRQHFCIHVNVLTLSQGRGWWTGNSLSDLSGKCSVLPFCKLTLFQNNERRRAVLASCRYQYLTCLLSSSTSEQVFSLSLLKTSISFLLKKQNLQHHWPASFFFPIIALITVVARVCSHRTDSHSCPWEPRATTLSLFSTTAASYPVGPPTLRTRGTHSKNLHGISQLHTAISL